MEKKNLKDLKNDLEKLSSVEDGQLQIKLLPNQSDTGPTSKITHRIVLSGDDQKGLMTDVDLMKTVRWWERMILMILDLDAGHSDDMNFEIW